MQAVTAVGTALTGKLIRGSSSGGGSVLAK